MSQSRLAWSLAWALAATATMVSGCSSLNPFKREDDEYVKARNLIEGYEDREGNWIRPEGTRADKRRGSDLPAFLQKIPGLAPRPVDKELARKEYIEGDALFEKAKVAEGEERRSLFRQAAKKYISAGKNWVSSALEQDSYLMTAESYFFAEDYSKAEDYYVKLVKEYPRTRYQDRVDQRRMEIGLYWLQFKDQFYHVNLTDNKRPWNDTPNHGKRVLEKMRLDNPTGKLADDVTMELANTQFKRENWNEALDLYRDLISTYPDSRHQFDAHFLGVKAAMQSYQGAEYSEEPLLQASKMIKQMTRQFPDQSQGQMEHIRSAYAEVVYHRAEREYSKAQYRYNKGEAKSARIYCTNLLANDEFKDTPFAQRAKEMLQKLEGMPSEPVQPLGWLATALPNRDRISPLAKNIPIEQLDEKNVQSQLATSQGNPPLAPTDLPSREPSRLGNAPTGTINR